MQNKNTLYEQTLILLCSLFAVLIIMSNLISQKFVSINFLYIYKAELSAGTLTYPFTFIISDLIAEFYGRERAMACVRLGIISSICVAFMIYLTGLLDATQWSKINNQLFDQAYGHYSTVLIGSLIASFVSQNLDIYLYLTLRKLTKGKLLWLRTNISTLISLFVDSAIVLSFMAMRGHIPYDHVFGLLCHTAMFKLLFSLFSTPTFYIASSIMRYILRNNITKRTEETIHAVI